MNQTIRGYYLYNSQSYRSRAAWDYGVKVSQVSGFVDDITGKIDPTELPASDPIFRVQSSVPVCIPTEIDGQTILKRKYLPVHPVDETRVFIREKDYRDNFIGWV